MDIPPLLIMAIGIATVLFLILAARLNAFLALLISAIVVSVLSPGLPGEKIARVAMEFGSACGKIGIVIALAAIIGAAMLESGSADRIVKFFVKVLGQKRAPIALLGTSYVLAIPVFLDTVFYLMVPLARSFYISTRKDYMKCLLAITGGGVLTHCLVPPTPGPLLAAEILGVNLGTMIIMGIIVTIPAAIVGYIFAAVVGPKFDIKPDVHTIQAEIDDPKLAPIVDDDRRLPGLFVSILPIFLPVFLIGFQSLVESLDDIPAYRTQFVGWTQSIGLGNTTDMVDVVQKDGSTIQQSTAEVAYDRQILGWIKFFGDANFALLLSTGIVMLVYHVKTNRPRAHAEKMVEDALTSGGMIILITAAGSAFGAMLRVAGVGQAIEAIFVEQQFPSGALIFAAFGLSSIIKIAQGSSTTAIIITAGMMAAMMQNLDLPFHPVYIALSIGAGALVGSWMNDSGFWVFTKMGGVTEAQGLKSWTPCLATVGIAAFLSTLVFSQILPMDLPLPPTGP